jgi:iron complex outermembrane receptor protein
MLEEVVVTARRREESLQDLPLSIQAISADAMQAQGVYSIDQVADFVPNLSLTEDIRLNDTRIFIRGIGGGFSNPAQIFGVGMYIDGHYQSGTLGAFMSTVDVERVEVLRGPQGTLFGKNTTGGAVNIISAKPGPEFDSYITLRAAEFGEESFRGMVNVPFTDNLFFRGNFSTETGDGYYYNRLLGQDTGGFDQQALGLALRWEASESWTIDARVSLSEDRDDNRGGQCVPHPASDVYDVVTDPAYLAAYDGPTASPQLYNGPGPFDDENGVPLWGGSSDGRGPGGNIDWIYQGALLDYMNACQTDVESGVFTTSQDMPNTYSNVDNNMYELNATWDVDQLGAFENASVQILTAHREAGYWYYQDRDFSPLVIDHVGNYGGNSSNQGVNRTTDEFEVIFNADVNDRLHLTAGVYWFDDDAKTGDNACLDAWRAAYDPNAGPIDPGTGLPEGTINGQVDDQIICTPEGGTIMPRIIPNYQGLVPGPVGISNTYGRTTGESKAIYGHITYDISENWEMAFGARYTEDDRTQNNIEMSVDDCLVPDANRTCSPTILLDRAHVLEDGTYIDAVGGDDAVTPTLSFTRNLAPGDTLESGNVYFLYSEGYLTGAFNDEVPVAQADSPEARAGLQALVAYDPEYVSNIEVGFKGTFLDGNLRIAGDIFFMDYTDKQEVIDIDNSTGALGPNEALEYTDNVAEVEVSGIELELRASPWDGGFVSLDVGVLDYKYTDFSYTDIALDPPEQVFGIPALGNRTPDWTITASVEHAFQLGNGATLTPQLGVYMQDAYEWLGSYPNGAPAGADTNVLPDGAQSALCHQDSYAKWRARLTYEPAGGAWQASLFGYNITDEEILLGCGATRSGTYRWYHQAPAQWGAEFRMNFGGNN